MKITKAQQKVIDILGKYPNNIIMADGWLTGGHGIKFDLKTVRALEQKGIISYGKLQIRKISS